MKQEEKLEQLIEVWDNSEKAQAIAVLRTSMSKSAETPRVPSSQIQDYVKTTISVVMDGGNIPDYPGDFAFASKSTFYKQAIREVVKEMGVFFDVHNTKNDILVAAWAECEKARTLIELRKALNLYGVALRANFYTDEDIAEYVEMIDEQDRELRRLREYKRIQDELFGIMTEDDEELHQVIQANKMRDMKLSDTEICKILKITRNRLNYLRRKIEVENVHGSVEF